MPNAYRDKLLTVGTISRRDRPLVREGREHPESGVPFKQTEDEATIVTEHSNNRVDATVKVAAPVHAHLAALKRKGRTDGK